MNSQQAAILCRYVRTLCPQQKFDEYSPDAWHDVLGDYQFDDARAAATTLAKRQTFISPAEIITQIRAIRNARLEGFVYQPRNLPDNDPNTYLADYRAQIKAVADGQRPAAPQRPALPAAPITDTINEAFTTPTTQHTPNPNASPLTIKCPKCAARIGYHCRFPNGGRRPTHSVRKRVARGENAHLTDDATINARRAASAAALAHLTDKDSRT